jgi:leucyl aminopeptidase
VSAADCPTDRIFLVGIGDQSGSALRAAGASVGRKVRGKNLTVYSACAVKEVKAHAISMALGAWVWNLKTDKKKEEPKILVGSKDKKVVEDAAAISQALCRARDLIHTPANIKTPAWMGKQAELFAKGTGLKVKILAGAELKEFGGLRAVGGSSPKPGPRMIEVSYQPKSKKKSVNALPHVVLVGKGITFDTGGVSLKRPYDTMMAMKSDMAGSAAILATLTALEELQPNVRVTALMMMAENAISGTAQRPSDVIKHYGGTTVEVINTDAEGRLVLADGLAYADINLDPDYLVDIATLTGAITLGLGRQYAAMYTRDSALAAQLSKAGEASGDRVWHMPLVDDYKDSLGSDIADFNHNASKGKYSAGSVTAALFLENFVGTRRWVHLDIAGTGRSEVDAGENSKGGTGYGVRLLTEWITSL